MSNKLAKFITAIAAATLTTALFVTPAHADTGCGTKTNKVATDIYKKLDTVLKSALCQSFPACNSVAKVNKVVKSMVKFWNWAAKNSWAKIGPRQLFFTKAFEGRIVSTGGRLWISPVPSRKDKVKVNIQELDGKGKTGVAICKTGPNGKVIKVANVMFNPNNKAQKNKRERKEIMIGGAKNFIISVHFDGKSVANTFKYKVRATPQ